MNKILSFRDALILISGFFLAVILLCGAYAQASFGINQGSAFVTPTPGNASTTQLTSTASTYLATAGGNVGVGTSSPFTTFSVQGTAYFSSQLTAGTVIATSTLYFGGLTPSLSIGEVGVRTALAVATTTPCAIQSPAATSTLIHFAFNVTTATSSAGTIQIASSTTAFATSSPATPIYSGVIGANAQGTITWSAGANNGVFPPNTWVVAGMTNGSAVTYGYTYGGTCSATFLTDN